MQSRSVRSLKQINSTLKVFILQSNKACLIQIIVGYCLDVFVFHFSVSLKNYQWRNIDRSETYSENFYRRERSSFNIEGIPYQYLISPNFNVVDFTNVVSLLCDLEALVQFKLTLSSDKSGITNKRSR